MKKKDSQPKTDRHQSKTVYLAMSGGVDSSLSAALLKNAGLDVTGVFIKAWHPPFLGCLWKEDRFDALRVSAHLGIPFKTIDLSKEYKKEVIDYLISEYKKGRTPNPDVMCNKTIKFGAFFEWAIKEGADYVATGHYSRIKKTGGKYQLLKGKDSNKDQSYFLWTLTEKHLQKTMFPIGHLKKEDVRKEAKKRGLITAEKKDSQGLCFVGKLDFKDFLKKYIKEKTGQVVDGKGNVIGRHNGAYFYTIGERRGFTITKKTPKDKPYYIVGKNIKKNEIIVAHRMPSVEKSKKNLIIKNINWISAPPTNGKTYHARGRYRQKLLQCTLHKKTKNSYSVKFENFANNEPYFTEGQSLVVYDNEICLGGGVIAIAG